MSGRKSIISTVDANAIRALMIKRYDYCEKEPSTKAFKNEDETCDKKIVVQKRLL